jgi:hypothetical protein
VDSKKKHQSKMIKYLEAKHVFGVVVAIVIILLFSIPFLIFRKKLQKKEKEEEKEFFETETIEKEIEKIEPEIEPRNENLEIKEINIVEEPMLEEIVEVPLTEPIQEMKTIQITEKPSNVDTFKVSKAKKKPIPGNLSSYYWVFEISFVDPKTNEMFEVHRRYSDFEWLINVLGM